MAIQFSDTTNRNGLVQLIEDRTGTQSSSTSSYSLVTKTRDINSAFSRFQSLAVRASGRWQVDDTNQVDYPIATMNLVANQQDYSFTNDGSSPANQVLDIHRIELLQEDGTWIRLRPIDEADINIALAEFQSTAGKPIYYDKTSNALFLYPKPSYSLSNALKLYYSRTPSYFLSTDTTKTAGIPDMFQEYLALRPSYLYCLQNGLPQASAYKKELDEMEEMIFQYYSTRQRDEKPRITVENNKYLDRTGRGGWAGGSGGTNPDSGNMMDWR